MVGLTSELSRGNRNGCDQSISSVRIDDAARCCGGDPLLDVNDDMELIAAFFRACSDVVRLDVNLDFGFGVACLLISGGDRIMFSSGSSK